MMMTSKIIPNINHKFSSIEDNTPCCCIQVYTYMHKVYSATPPTAQHNITMDYQRLTLIHPRISSEYSLAHLQFDVSM